MGLTARAAPVAHIGFLEAVPSRIGYLLDIAPKELEKVLYFAASIVTSVDNEKRAADLADLEDKVRGESERIFVDRDEQLAALEDRLSRRRDYFTKGKERNFDEDDEFWARGLSAWAEEQGLPPLEEGRKLVGGMLADVAQKITTEDSKKIRELVRNSAIRDDRQLSTRELENVANAALQINEALAPLHKEADKATGSKKGAVTKHMNKVRDALLGGEELEGEDVELVSGVDKKNLDKARDLGSGLLLELLETLTGGESLEEIRDRANDLCLMPRAACRRKTSTRSFSGRSRSGRCTSTSSRVARTPARRVSTRSTGSSRRGSSSATSSRR